MSFVFADKGNVRAEAEGVGSYGSAATLTSADTLEVERGAPPKHTPTMSPVGSLSPRRDGQELVKTDETNDVTYTAKIRAMSVPSSADTDRPSVHAIFRGGGALETYSDADPYLLTYSWQCMPGLMDSITVEDIRAQGANTTAVKRVCTGVRGSCKFTGTRGGFVKVEFVGKAKTYARTDSGAAVPEDALPTGQIYTLEGATLVLETVGGGTVYSGLLHEFEIDTAMRVTEVKGGNISGGLIDEVLLNPSDCMPCSVTVEDQLLAAFNAEALRDTAGGSPIHVKLTLPDVSDADNTLIFEYDASIDTAEDIDLGNDVTGTKIGLKGMWFHASAPGVTPAPSLTVTFSTAS